MGLGEEVKIEKLKAALEEFTGEHIYFDAQGAAFTSKGKTWKIEKDAQGTTYWLRGSNGTELEFEHIPQTGQYLLRKKAKPAE